MFNRNVGKAWFPINVSVIATNRSSLLARTLLRFASFHKPPSFGLLRGLLYFCFLRCWFLQVKVTAYRGTGLASPRKSSTCATLLRARRQAFVAKAVIACEHWCPYILRYRALLCVLLTHVWKPVIPIAAVTTFISQKQESLHVM